MTDLWSSASVVKRARVIIDNDFGGDPDGLVQLAHHLLSPSVEICGVISSHLRPDDGWNRFGESVASGIKHAEVVAEHCQFDGPIVGGSHQALVDAKTAQQSAGLELLIREAEKADDRPLYLACGGSLTQAASLFLTRPDLSEKITLIWIGGLEHEGHADQPPGIGELEYNFAEDPISVQVIFNESNYKFWQIPRNAYRQTLISRAEMETRLKPAGPLGEYLYNAVAAVHAYENSAKNYIGETYVMGDSPLVLLTALQSSFEPDGSSSSFVRMARPSVDAKGRYEKPSTQHEMRVYTTIDNRLMFEDFFAKLTLLKTR